LTGFPAARAMRKDSGGIQSRPKVGGVSFGGRKQNSSNLSSREKKRKAEKGGTQTGAWVFAEAGYLGGGGGDCVPIWDSRGEEERGKKVEGTHYMTAKE